MPPSPAGAAAAAVRSSRRRPSTAGPARVAAALLALAVPVVAAGCGGDSSEEPATTAVASVPAVAPVRGPFSEAVARRVFEGLVAAYGAGRFEDAATFWHSGLLAGAGNVCRTRADLARALRESAAEGPAWPGFRIVGVRNARVRPIPRADVVVVPTGDDRRLTVTVGFGRDVDGAWRLTEPQPIEAGNLCYPVPPRG